MRSSASAWPLPRWACSWCCAATPRRTARDGPAGGMMAAMGTLAIDHVISRDQHVWAFGPSMTPVLEVDPGAVIRLELNDCFSGQVTKESDLFTSLDLERLNSATGPIAVRGAEPGDSLVVELLEITPGPRGAAMIIPGFGQLIDRVRSPVTRIFRVEDGTVHMN